MSGAKNQIRTAVVAVIALGIMGANHAGDNQALMFWADQPR